MKKANSSGSKKLYKLELENESLMVKFEESASRSDELRVEKEFIEVKVKVLTSDL